jgi:YfiH family protein
VSFHHEVGGPVELWFTAADAGDLRAEPRLTQVATLARLEAVATMDQVHGHGVGWAAGPGPHAAVDALLTDRRELGLLVRVADCVPIVLAAPDDGLVGVVHSGRAGLVSGVVPAAVAALRDRGAGRLHAWVGPRVCGRCYELPAELADAVAAVVPEAKATTSWGTPAADIGAGVVAQLRAAEVDVDDVGADVCTIEDERFFSYRRQGDSSGRFGALVVLRDQP